jgi:hypothetical protein
MAMLTRELLFATGVFAWLADLSRASNWTKLLGILTGASEHSQGHQAKKKCLELRPVEIMR